MNQIVIELKNNFYNISKNRVGISIEEQPLCDRMEYVRKHTVILFIYIISGKTISCIISVEYEYLYDTYMIYTFIFLFDFVKSKDFMALMDKWHLLIFPGVTK